MPKSNDSKAFQKDQDSVLSQLQPKGESQESSNSNTLTVPNNLHITCSFIGKKPTRFQEVLKTSKFVEGEHYSVRPTHIAYVPSKLLTLKCEAHGWEGWEQKELEVESTHAHVTLGFAAGQGKNSIKPKHSNDLLEACQEALMLPDFSSKSKKESFVDH